MKALHICAENNKHEPYEVIVFEPDPDNSPKDYIPKGFNITVEGMVNLGDVIWPYYPSGSTFINVASIQANK